MKELSIQVKVIPFGNTKQTSYTFLANQFDFVPVPESTPAGTIYNCNKDLVIDHPDKEILKEFAAGVSARIVFTDSRDNKYIVGEEGIPAIISISPNLNTATLKIECKMIRSPYIG